MSSRHASERPAQLASLHLLASRKEDKDHQVQFFCHARSLRVSCESSSGLRIAVIVNDMASVNIDAELVRRGGGLVQQEEAKMIELSNGCICCTLREDLLTSLSALAAERRFDHVLVESSGISEPLPVAETFTFRDEASGVSLNDVAHLANLVTVVDAASIFEQLTSMDTLVDRGWHDDEGDERTVAHLLCDQLEFADMLLVNKCDLVTATQRGAVEAFVKKVNPSAEIIITEHSVLEPKELLTKGRFHMDKAEQHPQWLAEARENEHTPETIEYGITSFVFQAKRPFHPERLMAALGNQPRTGALVGLLRLKGFAWLPTRPHQQAHAALAGTQFTMQPGPPWVAAVPHAQWPEALVEQIQRDKAEAERDPTGFHMWDDEHGDRRTELVCIGRDLDREAARAHLEACLLTDEEMASGQQSWLALPDPFPSWMAPGGGSGGEGGGHVHDPHNDRSVEEPTPANVAEPLADAGSDVALVAAEAADADSDAALVAAAEAAETLKKGSFLRSIYERLLTSLT